MDGSMLILDVGYWMLGAGWRDADFYGMCCMCKIKNDLIVQRSYLRFFILTLCNAGHVNLNKSYKHIAICADLNRSY